MAVGTQELVDSVHAALTDILLPPEDWRIEKGKLHESLGSTDDGGPIAGVSPEEDPVNAGNQMLLEPVALVQVFLTWEKVVDNKRVVDPTPIMTLAGAFRVEIETRQNHNTDGLWFYNIERLWYPGDPTGQKTRFHARVKGVGDNPASFLRETGP